LRTSRCEYKQRIAEELCGTSSNNQSDELAEKVTGTSHKKVNDVLNIQMPQQNDTDMLHQ